MSHTLLSHTKVTNTTTTEINITSISQSYQDLCFWFVGHDGQSVTWSNSELEIHLNGDTGGHYTHQKNYAVGSSRYGGASDNATEFNLTQLGNKDSSSNCGATVFGTYPHIPQPLIIRATLSTFGLGLLEAAPWELVELLLCNTRVNGPKKLRSTQSNLVIRKSAAFSPKIQRLRYTESKILRSKKCQPK